MFRALAFAAGVAFAHGEHHWAVLVAGSNSYSNYRHQADVCHAYHVLIERGFHPEHIITMMYDDVAHDRQNPFPGKLYNFPWKTMEEAVDVYSGCAIDYRGKDVSPSKFSAVLKGDEATAKGRVLQSTADDHVFINFVDHGAVGLIAFPDPREVMHAKALMNVLEEMHKKKMYKQLTFYLETCESGSMFQGLLPKHLAAYAVTAANAKESSWGTYCGGEAKVAGKNIKSCLGDLFSVNWMADSDKTQASNESLADQYTTVKQQTAKSHVMRYGQTKHIGSEQVSDFEGTTGETPSQPTSLKKEGVELALASAVDARDATLDSLYQIYLAEGTSEAGEKLIKEIKARRAAKDLGLRLEATVAQNLANKVDTPPSDDVEWTEELLDCHEQATAAFAASCGWSENHLPLSKTLYKLCLQASSNALPVSGAINMACAPQAQAAEISI